MSCWNGVHGKGLHNSFLLEKLHFFCHLALLLVFPPGCKSVGPGRALRIPFWVAVSRKTTWNLLGVTQTLPRRLRGAAHALYVRKIAKKPREITGKLIANWQTGTAATAAEESMICLCLPNHNLIFLLLTLNAKPVSWDHQFPAFWRRFQEIKW